MKYLGVAFLIILFANSCVQNNVKDKAAYKKLFDKYNVSGCFAAYDNAFNEFDIYNLNRYRDSSYSPANTFNIVNSLIGLETGNIIENDIIKWNGKQNAIVNWNKDYNFKDAFKNSVDWYFQDVAHKIGKDTMQLFLDSLNYGSKKINSSLDSFWFNNTLTIKSDEQMGLIKKIYFNQLHNTFSNRSTNNVKDAMLVTKTDKYALSYITGLTKGKNNLPLAWVVGWVESGGSKPKINFFVLNMDGNITMEKMVEVRQQLLNDLLIEEHLL